ncbi:hypothetical protein ACFFRR_011357 [Megaselia abdita]
MVKQRKIPARKHHGIRDPLKQQEVALKKIQNKINNAPDKDFDQQQVGYKLREFIKLTNDVKSGKKMKKRLSAGTEDLPKNSKVKKIPKIKQFSGEDDKDFLKRVNRVTAENLKETGFEAKYGINVYKDPKTGKITVLQGKGASKNPEQDGKKAKKQKISDEKRAKMIKEAIKEEMIARKKEDKQEKDGVKPEYQKDDIKFGEIVHGPPTLTALPRKAKKADTVPRPGAKENLLLRPMMSKNPSEEKPKTPTKPVNSKITKGKLKIDLKGKRKNLPEAHRRMLENEQKDMIELYRKLKKDTASQK